LVSETWEKYDHVAVAHRRIAAVSESDEIKPLEGEEALRGRQSSAGGKGIRRRGRRNHCCWACAAVAEYRRARRPHMLGQALQPGIEPVHARFTRAYL
jgi:hypothetical protein